MIHESLDDNYNPSGWDRFISICNTWRECTIIFARDISPLSFPNIYARSFLAVFIYIYIYITFRIKVLNRRDHIARDKSVLAASIIIPPSLWAHATSFPRGSLAFIIDNWLDKIKWNVNGIYTKCEENPRACTHTHSYIHVKMSLTYITRADVKYDNAYIAHLWEKFKRNNHIKRTHVSVFWFEEDYM